MSGSICEVFEGNEQDLCYKANEFVRHNKNLIIKKFADLTTHPSEQNPISIFMAGSPGAGKTEFSAGLIKEITDQNTLSSEPVLIDPDEVRKIIPGYNGLNAFIFQPAAALGVEKLIDHVHKYRLSAIIDGTFAHPKTISNIQRALERGRDVEIYYLYQDPLIAWEFTKKREIVERRNIPKTSFIEAFFVAKDNVNKAKEIFGNKIKVNLVKNNFTEGLKKLELNIQNIDHHLDINYTREKLDELIK